MIEIIVSNGEVIARGLIPGHDILLTLDGERFLIHRHGPDCHVHPEKEALGCASK